MPKLRPEMRILSTLDRYVLREFALNLVAVLSILWLIYIATRFARYLSQAAMGNLPNEVIFSLLGYSSLGALTLLLPLSAFLAVMMVLGRMNVDNELVVMSACGLGIKKRIRQVLIFSGVVALVIAVLALWVVPDILSDRKALEQKAKVAADTTGLVAGSFKESRDGRWVFYAEKLTTDSPPKMIDIFIKIKNEPPLILRAKSGYFHIDPHTHNRYLVLEDGYRYEGEAGERAFTIAEFARHEVLIETNEITKARERYRTMSTQTLWQRGNAQAMAELQWRISSIVMTAVLGLLAIVLSQTGPRSGRYTGFFSAILVYIIYSNLLGVTRAWVAKESIAPWLGLIWVHLLMLLLVYILFSLPRWQSQRMRRRMAQAEETV